MTTAHDHALDHAPGRMAIAVVIGVASPVVGLYLSYWLSSAIGATIVLVETAVFLIAVALGPRTGLFRARPATAERAG